MIVYAGDKQEFLKSVEDDTIALEIEEKIHEKMRWHVAAGEFRAWENSLEYMYKVLSDEEIPQNAGVAIEYNIPQTSKRVDFLITGYDSHRQGNVVVVELKQWNSLEAVEGKDALVKTYTGNAMRQVVHPSIRPIRHLCIIVEF